MKKKINLIPYFFLFFILFKFIKVHTSSEINLNLIVDNNLKNINQMNNNITSYETKNQLFDKIKNYLKNITLGNELFEEEFEFLSNYNENIKKYDESLEHRLIPETLFEYKNKISCFNLISTKSITKDDTGHFVSILLLVGLNNSLIVSDLFGNIYLTYNITEEINDIITYNQNDISDFFVITNNFTVIKKFVLLQGLFYKNNSTKNVNNTEESSINPNNVIKVDTYAEDDSREKIEKLSYELVDIYRQNIKEERIKIMEEKNISFNIHNNSYMNHSNKDEYIITTNPAVIKGTKSLIAITNKKSVYKLNNQNLELISYSEIEPKNKSNYSNTLNPITMTSYYILFNQYENGFKVAKVENVSIIIAKCDLFPENSTEKIKYYFFDQKSRTLYILSNLFNVYIVTPMIIQTSHETFKNSCRVIFICKLNKIIDNSIQDMNNNGPFYISLLNKKLMITHDGIEFEVIDLTKIAEVDNENKLQTKIFSLSQFINGTIANYIPLITKNNNQNIFLYQIKNNSLLLFNYHEKSSKIYTSEPQSFNFKVPIILVAFIVILVWNYIKKKNENTGAGDIDLKNTINQIKEESNKVKID
jgi:hypothetical protein